MKYRLVSRHTHTIHTVHPDRLAGFLVFVGVVGVVAYCGVMAIQWFEGLLR